MENIQKLIARYPLVEDLVALKETTWFNPGATSLAQGLPYVGLTEQDVNAAHDRLARFAPVSGRKRFRKPPPLAA